MDYRIEKDSMGEVSVPSDKYWGAQTERSKNNFQIGAGFETMPAEIIRAFAVLKKAAAKANHALRPEILDNAKLNAICLACDDILAGKLDEHFPLVVWQTGSGTHTNMNVNEVIAARAKEILGDNAINIHPNDDINMSQSSNDTFPTAIHISAVLSLKQKLIPCVQNLAKTFRNLEQEHEGVVKIARTHLQDAVPIAFSQEISAWRSSLEHCVSYIEKTILPLTELSLGATAVGTGLNAPKDFDILAAGEIALQTGIEDFKPAVNKFHALSSKDAIVFAHASVKTLAGEMMKIANDVRLLASGPRCGLGEIRIPENEPGSSIMPGKVNPTQSEAMTMVAVQIMGNDTTIGIAASQGNFQLNVFMPVIAYNFLQSVRLLSQAIESFNKHCACGIKANRDMMNKNLHNSLMNATALNPHLGYENVAKIVKKAYEENISLKDACLSLGFLDAKKFDEVFQPELMI